MYDPLNLNAMLLKAGVLEERIISQYKSIQELQYDKQFIEYEDLISSIYKLGYREMPVEITNLIIARLQNDDAIPIFLKDNTPEPFKRINSENKKNKYATLSWGLFEEVHETNSFEQYGRTVFDTKKFKINHFVREDTLYNSYNFDPVVFGWSVDPMASSYPGISPYVAFADNTILFIDPSGNIFVTYIKLMNETTGKPEIHKVTFDGVNAKIQKMDKGEPVGSPTNYFSGTNDFVDDMITSYNYIVDNGADVDDAMKKVAESSIEFEVKEIEDPKSQRYSRSKNKIFCNFEYGLGVDSEKYDNQGNVVDHEQGIESPALGFWSEVYHAYIDELAPKSLKKYLDKGSDALRTKEENFVHVEKGNEVVDILRKKLNNPVAVNFLLMARRMPICTDSL